jgi:esterase/lipase superfamily enzyme
VTRRRRWLLIAAGVLVLLAAGLGGAAYLTTRRALERAEAFGFRRMEVPRQGEDGPLRFFYATNRRPGDPEGDLDARFENTREPGLRLGRFDVEIEPTVGLAALGNLGDWFRGEALRFHEVAGVERAEFVAELSGQVERSPHRGLLVAVNGFRERFPGALRKAAFLGHVLDIDAPVLVFDWPGNQGSTLRGYRRAQGLSRESGAELAELLELVVDEVQPEMLWLVANSMGGEVVVGALAQLSEDPAFADPEQEFEDVVLTAPDVSHARYGREFADELTALTRNLTVYVSSNDRALLVSRLINRGRRLGESTVDPANPSQARCAELTLELVEPDSDAVALVDVTAVNRTRNFHNFSLESPEFFDDLFQRLTNVEAPQSRLKYRLRTPAGTAYWVLTRGR